MLDVEFYRLYNGLRARDLMPCLCCHFAVIFAIFTKVYRVFFTIPCRDFLLSHEDMKGITPVKTSARKSLGILSWCLM